MNHYSLPTVINHCSLLTHVNPFFTHASPVILRFIQTTRGEPCGGPTSAASALLHGLGALVMCEVIVGEDFMGE